MDRRQFIRSSVVMAAGAALFKEFPAFAEQLKAKGEPDLKLGILSDIHITDKESCSTFRHALEYFREKDVDGVLIAGDMADRGLISELKLVGETWFEVFPKDKGLSGKKVEKLFIYGNHDVNSWDSVKKQFSSEEEWEKNAIVHHKEKSWKDSFKEAYEPIYIKTIKGYDFIGGHWYDDKYISGLEEFLESRRSRLAGDKPFFYFQHAHPHNTCNGYWAWGTDDGRSTEILGRFPNAVAFSGHSHDPLTDDRDLWMGSFTSIGTSSLRYQCPVGGRENSHLDGGPGEDYEMPKPSTSDGRQGMLMYLYGDCIALEKRDFVFDEPLGDNWIIPVSPAKPLTFEERARKAVIPQFNKGDKVTVTKAEGKSRNGDVHNQVTVHFPSVLKKTHNARAFDYEVAVEAQYVDVHRTYLTKRVYSPKCYLGESQDMGEVTCVFAESELPKMDGYRFVVRPCECFGGKGEPICSEWTNVRTEY